MEEALKNPHYKKIWEKVIMNRHPEAKSLEEALELESREFCSYGVVMYKAGKHYGQLMMFRDMHEIEKCNSTQRPEILGRPIILTDILKLLYKPKNECLPEIRLMPTNFWEIAELPEGLYVSINAHEAYGGGKLFIWNITTDFLEKQTPETWKKISKIKIID